MGSEIKSVGVIGAGQMGCGIAQVSAAAGYQVHIYDLSPERIEAALATVNGNLARQVTNSKITEDERKDALARITGSSDLNDLASADLVIEAATEDEAVKRKIYSAVCPTPSSPPTPRRCPSPASPPHRTGRNASWASIS